MRIRSVVELVSENFCLVLGHDWIVLKNGALYCKRCGKKSN